MPIHSPPSNASSLLVHLHQAEVRRQGRTLLTDISFCLHKDQNVLVLGRNGAGKSTFLALVRGDIWPVNANGQQPRRFYVQGRWQASPLGWREQTALVSPELELRYRRLSRSLTCAQVISSGAQGDLCPGRTPSEEEEKRVLDLAADFGLHPVLSRPFAALSQGEAQKTLLARALMGRARVLFLDEVGTGLDPRAREEVLALIHDLAARGTQIVASTHRPRDLAGCMHQVVTLSQGSITDISSPDHLPAEAGPEWQAGAGSHFPGRSQSPEAPIRLHLERATVAVQGQVLLGPITWTVRADEHWLVQGANGSGKTTLLKLIAGEVPPCLGGSITRLPPVASRTLSGLRQKCGFFSSELITEHNRSQTGLRTVLSGLRGQIGLRDTCTAAEEKQALDWMRALEIDSLAEQDILTMSTGQLRRVLLARAVVQGPGLLLLDEPCAGLDSESRGEFLATLERLARHGVQMILVSHRPEDTFASLNRLLVLEGGRVVDSQGV